MTLTWQWIEDALADLRYASRQLLKAPAFAVSAIATLAIGIGANSAIYSVINAALLHPLPYREPGRLVLAWGGDPSEPMPMFYSFSYPRFTYFREHVRDVADLAAYDDETITVTDRGEPIRLEGGRVSANFFSVLGVKPEIGRDFLPEEDRHGARPVALLSDRYWRTRYNANPNVLGRTVRVDDGEFTIVGVLLPGSQFRNDDVDIWRTRIVDTRTFAPESVRLGARYLTVVGRLRGSMPVRQAQAMFHVIDEHYKNENRGNSDVALSVQVDSLEATVFANARMPLLVLWGAVACLLLIACANVANLVLARATSRGREIALRLAIGADRGRIARQLITEGVLLSLCGAVASLPVAFWSTRLLLATVRKTMSPIPDAHPDITVMALTLLVAMLVGIVFGLSPVLLLLRGELAAALNAGGRSASASARSIRFREMLVGGEVALCLILLTAAALLGQSFIAMSGMRTGLNGDKVAVMPLDLMPDRYQTWEARSHFYDDVLRRVSTLPGVSSAAITSRVDLLQHGLGYMLWIEGTPDLGSHNPAALGRSVSPAYFSTLGISLLQGRTFADRDSISSARVMVVNEAFARHFFPGVNPIGKHVTYSTDRTRCEIVGVVRDVRSSITQAGPEPTMYLPLVQRPWLVARLLVRAQSPGAIAGAVRKQVREVDPDQAAAEVRTFDDVLSDRLGQPRATMFIVVVFAAVALLLAAIGIYGVTAYSVAQRTREIGIRMALGADKSRVRRLILRRSSRVLLTGVIAGVPLSLLIGRMYSSLLFEARAADPVVMAGVIVTLAIVALMASGLPALRAAEVDPVSSLRAE